MTTLDHSTSTKNRSTRGILLLLTAFFIFSIQDVIIKTMSGSYALLQIVLIRTTFTIPIVLTVLRFNGGLKALRTRTPGLQLWRGIAMLFAYIFFFMALATLPFSTNQALFFSSPLFITALSAPLLKEEVGWRRWLAVIVGFIGVLIIVRPDGASFEIATIFAIAAALTYALSIIATRKLDDNGAVTTVYTTAAYLTGALILHPIFSLIETSSAHPSIEFLTRDWPSMPARDIATIAVLALIWGLGMFLLSTAYNTTAVATLAPIEYASVGYGILFGFIFWQEIPTATMLIGLTLIVGSGLFIIYRENRSASRTSKVWEEETFDPRHQE